MKTAVSIGILALLNSSIVGCGGAPRRAPPVAPTAAIAPASPWPDESLPPSPPIARTNVRVIEVITPGEAQIRLRPWTTALAGTAGRGARLRVRGVTKGADCAESSWYAIEPFGFICGADVRPSDQPPSEPTNLEPLPGSVLPFQYVIAIIPKGENIPLWQSMHDLQSGAPPMRTLRRGDAIAAESSFEWNGKKYWLSLDGMVIASEGSEPASGESQWHGVTVERGSPPIGWMLSNDADLYAELPTGLTAAGIPDAKPISGHANRRTQVRIRGDARVANKRYLDIELPKGIVEGSATDRVWVDSDAVNEAHWIARPAGLSPSVRRWVDVDVGEQVLVAYEDETPIFATLVSTGRSRDTPTGTYPVWGAALAIRMSGRSYFLDKVPWAIFFQAGNALHAAYWHDAFGNRLSHGCINMAPMDARRIFEWMVDLPAGWTGVRPPDPTRAGLVHVRNSGDPERPAQQRRVGPPQAPQPPKPPKP